MARGLGSLGALMLAWAIAWPAAAEAPALQQKQGDVAVDWAAGTLAATAGAAADLRMPSAELARPGAERRARAAALGKLKVALGALPLGGERRLSEDGVTRALDRAQVLGVDYQSNGGVWLRLGVKFTDWLAVATPAPPEPAAVLAVPSARLAAAPLLKIDKHEVALGAATYRVGSAPAGTAVVAGRFDKVGRLVVAGDAALAQKLAGAAVVIYVEKVTR